MAKLYFNFSTMNAGKSTVLLQAAHNYNDRGMQTYLLTAQLDTRAGEGRIASRIGIARAADTFAAEDDLFARIEARLANGPCACIFVDEAQFLTEAQVWQLARAVDDLGVPIMCYGLRTICHCGKKATMGVRQGPDGKALREGAQIEIGGNERYVSLCRRHWRAVME